ncbi:uncharacterized protein A4U43_C01F28620 [Asparagus officinalis]|uniref:Uncharacterized protein n=1 Tax=Asparagus officinalis TaxID=4686 RepID=A0A5P1FSW0_ASPOF|nr:uncharacterized protein LOC109829060 [Asparagus officinalis]ONK81396.1 uncharacterized protein A4U43_C01F28620 [Asparagus officinalis]
MARHLQSHHHLPSLLSSASPPLLLLLLLVAAIASIILSLCTTKKHTNISKLRSKLPSPPPPSSTSDRKLVGKLSGMGSKAMVVAKMVSWTRGGDREEEEEAAVWRKSILMGEKCRPLNFSGKIVYDEEGNEVKEAQERVAGGGK